MFCFNTDTELQNDSKFLDVQFIRDVYIIFVVWADDFIAEGFLNNYYN